MCPNPELLAAYIDRNVMPDEQKLVESHLEGCDRCLELVSSVIASKMAVPDPLPPNSDPFQ